MSATPARARAVILGRATARQRCAVARGRGALGDDHDALRALRRALCALLCACACQAAGLDPRRALTQFRHQAWHTRDGLPQSSVEALAQTSDGYLWVGTQEGVARYDGQRFTVFDKASTRVLRHNRIVALYADTRGWLWIGTDGGGLARYADGVFSAYARDSDVPSERVRSIAEDATGRVWVGTEGGLVGFDRERRQGPVLLAGESIEALARDVSGGLLIGSASGLHRLRSDGRLEELALGAGRGPVLALWADRDGGVWIGRGRTLLHWSAGETPRAWGEREGLPGRAVKALRRDRDGALWLGTEGGGLLRFDGRRFERFSQAEGLLSDHVLALLEDREGHLWAGVQDGGLHQFAAAPFVPWTTREGLAGDVVWPVLGDRQGGVWIGTSSAGLDRLADGRVTHYGARQGLPSPAVQALALERDGALWVGTRGGGLLRLENGRVTRRLTTADGLPGESVSAVLPASDGTLWIGLRGDAGLARLVAGRLRVFGPADGLPRTSVHGLLESRDGSIWIATDGNGAYHFAGGALRAYTTRDGLSSDLVNTFYEEPDGTLWIGTYGGGLNRLRAGRISSYTTSEGLYDDAVFAIVDDQRGHLFVSCNKGVVRLAKADFEAFDRGALRPTVFDTRDGMRNRECNGANQPPAWRAADGTLWFPTIAGVVQVDPRRLAARPGPTNVLVEQWSIDGRAATPRDGAQLGPGVSRIEIRYSAPTFDVPDRVRFRHRLQGFDHDWIDAGAERVAHYGHLPAGTYRFEVMAAGADGNFGPQGASLTFVLRPHAFESPWFHALAALGVMALLGGAYRLRVRRLAHRARRLEQVVDERTRELAEANRRLERLSTLDGLTSIGNRRLFDERLDLEWRRACRLRAPLALALIDVDAFKAYNDGYGHPAGDEVLKRVAQSLAQGLTRAGDFAARYGGEEFAVLLPHTDVDEARRVAERLRARVEALDVPHAHSSVGPRVTVSVGVAGLVPSEQLAPGHLVAAADRCLYEAKRAGRNRTVAGSGAEPAPAPR